MGSRYPAVVDAAMATRLKQLIEKPQMHTTQEACAKPVIVAGLLAGLEDEARRALVAWETARREAGATRLAAAASLADVRACFRTRPGEAAKKSEKSFLAFLRPLRCVALRARFLLFRFARHVDSELLTGPTSLLTRKKPSSAATSWPP
jgi:hypothetical protein